MKKYHIRFNTKHCGSDLAWRVFEDGVEHLASAVKITGEVSTECTEENGQTKWNIVCYGNLSWDNKIALIKTESKET
jgi:hypothetical protein